MSTLRDRKRARKIGARMPDGTIYVGLSPDTVRPMFTTPRDAPLIFAFDEARTYARNLNAHGRCDWRVPSKAELNVLFRNRAAVGDFNTRRSGPASLYWARALYSNYFIWTRSFRDGLLHDYYSLPLDAASLRCVRG